MGAVVEKQAQVVAELPAQGQEAATLLTVIERASRDPSVDITKLERLLDMHERVSTRIAEGKFNAAMSACQGELRPVAQDASNPQTHSKYASYAALDKALRPIYTKHGFSISYDEADAGKPEHVRVVAYVAHSGGFTRTYHADIPCDGKGAKGNDVMTKTHAVGAAKSYGARYLLRWVFNVSIGEDDRDGNDPSVPKLSEKEQADITAMLTEHNFNLPSFLRWAKVKTLGEIPAANYKACVQSIRAKARAR